MLCFFFIAFLAKCAPRNAGLTLCALEPCINRLLPHVFFSIRLLWFNVMCQQFIHFAAWSYLWFFLYCNLSFIFSELVFIYFSFLFFLLRFHISEHLALDGRGRNSFHLCRTLHVCKHLGSVGSPCVLAFPWRAGRGFLVSPLNRWGNGGWGP